MKVWVAETNLAWPRWSRSGWDDFISAETLLLTLLVTHQGFTSNQPHNQTQYPPYGLPLSYTQPMNNNSDPHIATSNLQNQTQHQDSYFENNYEQDLHPPTHDALNHQLINPTPIVILHCHQYEDPHSTKMLQLFEERLRAIKGANYSNFNVASLCLILSVVIPLKFKLLEFDKYKGNTYPKNHLTMYYKKIASHAHDNKLPIHFFQESLIGATLK
ncbi:hypothetical protein CR513_26130, partial [Mucuna pruriens]